MMPVRHLLILEDIPETAMWVEAAMRAEFHDASIIVVHCLSDALAWLNRQSDAAIPLCLVDLGLPDGSGVDFIVKLMRKCPGAQAIVTTLFNDDHNILSAMAAGAAGYVLKDQQPAAFAARIASLDAGEVPMSPSISRRILEQLRKDAAFRFGEEEVPLTKREVEVLGLVGRGLRGWEIASLLGLSDQTVPGYLKSIYRKLGVNNRAEAAVEAARRRLT